MFKVFSPNQAVPGLLYQQFNVTKIALLKNNFKDKYNREDFTFCFQK